MKQLEIRCPDTQRKIPGTLVDASGSAELDGRESTGKEQVQRQTDMLAIYHGVVKRGWGLTPASKEARLLAKMGKETQQTH